MDLVYLLGSGSRLSNRELRWSLRSVERHCRNVGRVIVVGDDPGFLSTEATFMPYADLTDMKHMNMLAKVLHVIRTGLCTEEFLVSSDDHVFVGPADLDRYPFWCRGWIPGSYPRLTGYRRGMLETRALLSSRGYPAARWAGHYDMHVDPKYADEVVSLAADGRFLGSEPTYGYEPFELFINVKASHERVVPVPRIDIKLKKFRGQEAFAEWARGYDSVSYADSAFEGGAFIRFLDRMYPEPSRWEVGDGKVER